MEETTKEREPAQAATNAALMLAKKIPDIGIKLSRTFEFTLKGGSVDLAVPKKGLSIGDTSYLQEKHALKSELTNSIKINERQAIDLPPGVTMIMGRSGSGKTKLALGCMAELNDNVVYTRFGEPLDKYFINAQMATEAEDAELAKRGVGVNSAVQLLQFEVDVAAAIGNFLFGDFADVLIIDSLRYLFYAGGGATGKGGVNMTLFADISFLDTIVNQRNKSLIVIVNPLTDDDAQYKAVLEAARGSVSALIDMTSPTNLRYSSRYDNRDWKTMNIPEQLASSPQRLDAPSATKLNLRSYTK